LEVRLAELLFVDVRRRLRWLRPVRRQRPVQPSQRQARLHCRLRWRVADDSWHPADRLRLHDQSGKSGGGFRAVPAQGWRSRWRRTGRRSLSAAFQVPGSWFCVRERWNEMALSLESIYKPLNDFFLNRFGTTPDSPVCFRFDKINSDLSDADCIDPQLPPP